MRRFAMLLGILLCLLGVPVTSVQAQPNPLQGPQNITVVDAGACATTGACASFPMNNFTTGAVDVSGTFSGTLTPEVLVNTTWVPVTLYDATGAPFTTITVPGAYSLANTGFARVRLRAGTFASGTAVVWLRQGFFMAKIQGVGTASTPGIATTSTNGFSLVNPTPATAGIPVQMSPRMRWCGAAWNSVGTVSESDCFIMEVLPATVAGTTTSTFRIGYIDSASVTTYIYTMSNVGAMAANGSISSNNSGIQAATGATIGWANVTKLFANTDKQLLVRDAAAATGAEISMGSATLGACTGGTITTGSHNFAGGYTGNTSSSCIITFGTPNWVNAPFCVAMSIASTTHPRVSATSTSSITITGGVSGEAITYGCWGRIGT